MLESVPLLAEVLRTLLQTRNLRVLLLDVSSQPPDLGLQVEAIQLAKVSKAYDDALERMTGVGQAAPLRVVQPSRTPA